jgi:NAD-reducing hydrogenase large subunit
MSKIIVEPVTRIEGHAKIAIHLDDGGNVNDAVFHVVEFRGFEKFCEGRHFIEMPTITERICGICPVSHHLASVKACDAIIGVEPPRPARLLRELMHMGQIVQSHALSFFYLSAPDFVLGFDAEPASRNIVGLALQNPEMGLKGITLRKFGQEIISALGGKRVHPNFCVPGGVNQPLSPESRDGILGRIDDAMNSCRAGISFLKTYIQQHLDEFKGCGSSPSNHFGLVNASGNLEHYDGFLRVKDANGNIVLDKHNPDDYLSVVAERTEEWSYLKFPYYKPWGFPEGTYRVGPLARLNIVDSVGTPLAQDEWDEVKNIAGEYPINSPFFYHYARFVEILFGLERIQQILEDKEILSKDVIGASQYTPKNNMGIGVIEAPRGTLFHHYWVDDNGRIEKVNLIVSTGQNNYAMNQGVKLVAKRYVNGKKLKEGMLNRVEGVIRCYDPCLSCSTHAIGSMPMVVQLISYNGELLDEVRR